MSKNRKPKVTWRQVAEVLAQQVLYEREIAHRYREERDDLKRLLGGREGYDWVRLQRKVEQ